ncbi:hypothetical protein KGF54_003294 [Candida jiufengensis]|uniref:uncharacterized protein n=1 Tax=Candida jiufengensis TaxID=497108 RepID=UPI002224B140|nr:uncharacterized protein KGF54_003294 [Candida jiufengensis]KAI5952427.1 hypothetical protein KGF54_003294 [Candida jiufengensis]
MTNYSWDKYKGYHINHNTGYQSQPPTQQQSKIINGIDLLPWDEFLPRETESHQTVPPPPQKTRPKKLTKSEKREIKQIKKINVQRRKELERNTELGTNGKETEVDFKPYLVKQELKNLFNSIILQKKQQLENNSNKKISPTEDFPILKYNSVSIYKSDLKNYLPNEWLNDGNLSLIFEFLNELFIKSQIQLSHEIQLIFPSIVQLIQHFPSNDIENLLPIAELTKSKFIFLPINLIDDDDQQQQDLEVENNGDHWILGILSLIDYKLFIYDSMTLDDDMKTDLKLHKFCKKLESCSLIPSKQKIKLQYLKCDQQKNFDDCGIFVIMITCYLINELIFGKELVVDEDGKNLVSLDISGVRFNPLACRLSIMKLISKSIEY